VAATKHTPAEVMDLSVAVRVNDSCAHD
jgi:hypothetical protein